MATWKKAKDIKSLMAMIEKDIMVDSLFVTESVANKVYELLHSFTDDWYRRYQPSPESYIRTYEFIDSLTITSTTRQSNEWQVGVLFDPMKMTQGLNEAGHWYQHEDRVDLSQIINDGWEYRRDGSGALDETIKYLKSSGFFTFLEKEFKKLGYKII